MAGNSEERNEILEIVLKRNILIPSNEIYGTTGGFYDYGPVGAAIKRKIQHEWRKFIIQRDGFHEIETSLILPEIVLKASGHVSHFTDPIVTCVKCKGKFRADKLLEEKTGKNYDGLPPDDLAQQLVHEKVACPNCKGKLEQVAAFNLMFKTNIGPVADNAGYNRPETAQGIFLDFPRIFRNYGSKLPIGIAQIGKSFRNEISPRQGLVRLREFTQMELEYFFDPTAPKMENFASIAKQKIRIYTRAEQEKGEKGSGKITEKTAEDFVKDKTIPNEIQAYFIARATQFYLHLGLPQEKFWFRHLRQNETPHYSGGNFDLEFVTSYGKIETIGIAYRTDFDLKSHSEMSKQDLSVFIEERKAKILPYVVEPSFGVDRLLWCILETAYRNGGKGDIEGRDWAWFDFSPVIAPYDCAIFPLMKKDGLSEKAEELYQQLLEQGIEAFYSETGSIGKRYARADEIGVPYALTIDYDSLQKGDCTIRFRNDGKQERIKLSEVADKIKEFKKKRKVTL
ncbi:Proline--tRNA ligase [Candidatus Gugararchaeum adminiculabundum]|nr:Proline--tRNA ligase [Candidatus Gugararchaeum adminiculabundum]